MHIDVCISILVLKKSQYESFGIDLLHLVVVLLGCSLLELCSFLKRKQSESEGEGKGELGGMGRGKAGILFVRGENLFSI